MNAILRVEIGDYSTLAAWCVIILVAVTSASFKLWRVGRIKTSILFIVPGIIAFLRGYDAFHAIPPALVAFDVLLGAWVIIVAWVVAWYHRKSDLPFR